ncbi:MAG: tetraacyldisaccharide 4'-kinase [Alphaproteobacteria bacterium]|nr:tetraacyldisaccharide 4'-kinase [Alphaproteobacteria bacterium]
MLATPVFWGKPPGFLADLLSPIGAAYDTVGRLRRVMFRSERPPVPVVCVGNLVTGGAGKTPIVMALSIWLAERGIPVHVVTRGYGGRLRGPVRVDPTRHDAQAVGDEALLLAIRAPCWVSRDRTAGVRAAVADGAGAILLDDGFQNPTVAKTLGLVVVDAGYGFGNERVIPAGPLRENLRRGLARADAVVLLAADRDGSSAERLRSGCGAPVLSAMLEPVSGERLTGVRLLAFAGIGRPEKFFATLRALGANLVDARAFADHHAFRVVELEGLRRDAERAGARLITTAKDIVRVPSAQRAEIEVLDVEIRWPDPMALDLLFEPVVRSIHVDGRELAGHLR